MTNKQKAEEIAIKNSKEYLVSRNDSHKQNILFKENSIVECEKCAMEMAEWKDEQINLLLDAIDYVFLKTDGTYGDLPLVVVDEVEYLKSLKYDKRR